jgi:phospholipid/cholesterol/gamma-HCH transport system permease protein
MASLSPWGSPPASAVGLVTQYGRAALAWLADWQRVFMFGAMACVLAVSPSTYDRTNRGSIARHIHLTSWRILPGFILLAGVVSLALIRVVLVTALHYGLAKFALDLVVKVLVLEVIPLFAALYVALRDAITRTDAPLGIFLPRNLDGLDGAQTDRIRDELVPRFIAYGFSVFTMVAVSGLVTLLMAYWSVYGFSRWGLGEFTRSVAHGFDGVSSAVFVFKVFLMSLAVAVIPIAAGLNAAASHTTRLQPGAARLVAVLFAIAALALALRYS